MSLETIAVTAPTSSASTDPWPRPFLAWYAIFIFALGLMMNFLDRGIVSLLVHPLEVDLHLNDAQIGYVTGFAYIAFYAVIGLPIARWADVGNRRNIVAAGVAVWSLATAFCGLATSFWQLFAARMAVGAGESCNGPAVFSMISDLFPREQLPRAIAVLNFGFIAGTGLAALLGGVVIHLLSNTPSITFPLVGALHTWQMVFIAVGIPGLVISLLMLTVKEPVRRGRTLTAAGKHTGVPLPEVGRFMKEHRGTYGPMFFGLGTNTIMAFGVLVWGAEYSRRPFHWEPADFAVASGLVVLVCAPPGAMFGSWLAERFQRQGRDDANMRVVLLSMIFAFPGLLFTTLAPNAYVALAITGYTQFVAMWVPGPMNAALQVVTPNQMRATVTALFLFIFNIVGFGLGPSIVATITQYVFHDPAMLRYAMATVITVLAPLGIASIWLGLKAYGLAVARARSWT